MKIGYSRVSTARQGQPLETQREVLLDAIRTKSKTRSKRSLGLPEDQS